MIRWLTFNTVGGLGFVVQIGSAWLFRDLLGVHYLVATALAIELAVLHNFIWHQRWTWADRRLSGARALARLARFHATNGAISLAGNLALVALLVDRAGTHYLAANVVAVIVCSIANFIASDRMVFTGESSNRVIE